MSRVIIWDNHREDDERAFAFVHIGGLWQYDAIVECLKVLDPNGERVGMCDAHTLEAYVLVDFADVVIPKIVASLEKHPHNLEGLSDTALHVIKDSFRTCIDTELEERVLARVAKHRAKQDIGNEDGDAPRIEEPLEVANDTSSPDESPFF